MNTSQVLEIEHVGARYGAEFEHLARETSPKINSRLVDSYTEDVLYRGMPVIRDYTCYARHKVWDWEQCVVCLGLGVITRQLQDHFGIRRSERAQGSIWDGKDIRVDLPRVRHPGIQWHELMHWLLLPESRQGMPDYGFGFDAERYPKFAKWLQLPSSPPSIPTSSPPSIPTALVVYEEELAVSLAIATQRLWVYPNDPPRSVTVPSDYAKYLRPRLDSHPILATLPLAIAAGQCSPEATSPASDVPSPAPP